MAVCFLLAGKTSARSGRTARRLRTTDDVHGPVVRQVVWSPWPVVQWSPQCCGSCRLVASHESHSRTGFGMHSTRDGTCGLMFCLVEEIERQDPSQDGISVFSLNFTVLSRGKVGLVEESESQDPSRDGISVFSLNCRVLSWGKGRRTEIIAQRMSGVGRSLACVGVSNGSEWLCQSCRIVAGSAGLLVVLVPGRFPNSQFCPSTDPVLFNCVPARF